jgi:hypothetical protein
MGDWARDYGSLFPILGFNKTLEIFELSSVIKTFFVLIEEKIVYNGHIIVFLLESYQILIKCPNSNKKKKE